MDSDGAKKTLQQFQNKPWSSVVSNSNSPSISSTLNNAGVSNIPKIDDDKIKQEIMDVDSN